MPSTVHVEEVVGAGGPVEATESLRLTVKEKVLIQLGEFVCERDLAEYPVELTQKGLAEHLGARRSHIAISLKGLIENGSAEVGKARVEGETRRQNVYTLTPKGCSTARELKARFMPLEVEFEDADGRRTVRVSDLVVTSRLTLMMVVNQLERGGPIRDEINIVSRPAKRLISIFCPTCRRTIEVENIFGDEVVGFDCPGCGRPYRISPAERTIPAKVGEKPTFSATYVFVVLFLLVSFIFVTSSGFFPENLAVAVLGGLLAYFVPYIVRLIHRTGVSSAILRSAAVVLTSFAAGFLLVVLWAWVVIPVDLYDQLLVFVPITVAIVFGYIGVAKKAPGIKGEFLLAVGLLLLLLALSQPFTDSMEGFGEGSMPFLGTAGVSLVVLSTLHVTDKDNKTLAATFSVGIFVLLLAAEELLPPGGDVLDVFMTGGFFLLGGVMASLRFAQPFAGISLAEQFVSSIPLSLAIGLMAIGGFVFVGGSPIAGIVEVGVMFPFAFYGATIVFDGAWMYKVPIVAFLVGFEMITITCALAS